MSKNSISKKLSTKLIMIAILFAILSSHALALQETVGSINFSLPVGGTATQTFGVRNERNQTISVSLRIEGDDGIAKYITLLPTSMELQPGILTNISVTATIPKNYNSYGNLNGTIYILQVDAGGGNQVSVNLQLKKKVMINLEGYTAPPGLAKPKPPVNANVTPPRNAAPIPRNNNTGKPSQSEQPTGEAIANNYISSYFPVVLIVLLVSIFLIFMILRRRKKENSTYKKVDTTNPIVSEAL